MIEACGLEKYYGELAAVRSISFSARPGEITGFLGPNGAGKSSTLRMLSTLMRPTSGTARIAGFDVITEREQARRVLGYLPESPPLYPEMRVTEFLKFIAAIRGINSRAIPRAVERVMEECALRSVAEKLCGHLSKGMRQRVGLAQSVIHNPRVLILDEPCSGLDPAQIIGIRDYIRRLAAEKTVLLSTHVLQEVSELCSHVIFLVDGEIRFDGALTQRPSVRDLEELFLPHILQPGVRRTAVGA